MLKRPASAALASPAAASSASAPAAAAAAAPGSTPPSPSAAKKKRRSQPMGNLTNLQKRQLCIKFSQVKMTQQELCQWAKREFQLAHLPHQSTISKILARSEELTQMAPRDLSARRKGLVTHPELDTALCNWVLCARHNGLKISGDIIKSQARSLAAQLGIASTMSFSNGWLGGFKKRYNIRLGSAAAAMDGVNGAAMPSSISSLEQLQETARLYDPRDVYCMQETGLYYQLSPEKPAGRGRAARKENCGERLTVVFAVNADASDKTEPMFIGPGKLPQPAEELDADSRHFYYQNNKRAWMTPVMFQDYVSALDTRMRDEGRIVLLLVSPAPAHVTLGLELSNVRLEILPPSLDPLPMTMQVPVSVSAEENANLAAASESIAAAGVGDTPMPDADQSLADSVAAQSETTTKLQTEAEVQTPSAAELSNSAAMANMAATMAAATTLQPLDAGLITAFKRRYRRYHMLYALDRYEAGRQDVFHVDQLQAMRWVRHCWKQELPEEIVRKCWNGLEIFSPKLAPETLAAFDSLEEEIDKEICDTVSALDILRPLPIDEFVSPRDENAGIHCAGLEETDFMFTVPDNSGVDAKHNGKKGSPSNADATKQQSIVANELTPRLQELHARIEASASSAAAVAAASALSLTTSVNSVTADGSVGLPSSVGTAEEALGLSATGSSAAKLSDGPATNEELIECFKVLLPELDRLRFDDHTKKSIRTTFRKLKEAVEQQALDRKRGALKKPQPSPQAQPQFQQAMAQQQSLQELQQLQQQQIQQMQQQLMMQSEQQAMAMAAQASQIGENTVL
ncbi:ars binding protein 1 [Phytophthora cinnamomi]|uniref:ars binding protein 1 n=1 Tax=Phytophthora cinnamomi TaxID=4785 RepID=UPI003559F869|nr:ars binding protein 1 [Phytophthora cinnamomi]